MAQFCRWGHGSSLAQPEVKAGDWLVDCLPVLKRGTTICLVTSAWSLEAIRALTMPLTAHIQPVSRPRSLQYDLQPISPSHVLYHPQAKELSLPISFTHIESSLYMWGFLMKPEFLYPTCQPPNLVS